MGKPDLSEPALRAAEKAASVQDAVRSADGWEKRWKAVQAATEAAADSRTRGRTGPAALHAKLLGDQGFHELTDWLASGRYWVEVPEGAALLCVAWLALHGHADDARRVLDEISPRFHQLRFYPVPATEPRRDAGVCLYTLAEVRARWERMRVPARILHQRQVLGTCVPLHDRLIASMAQHRSRKATPSPAAGPVSDTPKVGLSEPSNWSRNSPAPIAPGWGRAGGAAGEEPSRGWLKR